MINDQDGSLAIEGGRDIAPLVNSLLSLPFALRVATKDFHPRDHISFASNHAPPNNKPSESVITMSNPLNAEETEESRLWPDHCVQGTTGCDLVAELDVSKFQHIVEKGQDARVEMYSAFAANFTKPVVANSGLAKLLHDTGITHVYVAGLAFEHCVKATAIHASQEGFQTYVIREATRSGDASLLTTEAVLEDLERHGVQAIAIHDAEKHVIDGRA